ncbi:MAG: cytochrome P450 [Myxococcota bacterium]
MSEAAPPVAESGWDWTRPDYQERLHEIYRELRDHRPLAKSPAGFWAVSRFADVYAVSSDPATFSSERTLISPPGLVPTIQSLDPPRHDRLRALVSLAFTPSRVRAMEPRVRAIARELLDGFAADGRADLVAQYARHIPSRVIGEMIGIPAERIPDFLHWTEAMVELPQGKTQAEAIRDPAASIYAEFAALLEERRRTRCDDLMSALIDAKLDGAELTQEELLGFCFVLVVAGNDTTTNLIANGAVLLAEHPDQRRLLAHDPSLLPDAIEEMLRYEAPAQALPRRLTRDATLHGQTLREGEQLFLLWGSANRDEREFEDADRFDVRRRIKRHLGFGQGVHFCLGKSLARLEARVAFEELLARAPGYELAGPAPWLPSMWARAHASVPVAFSRER